MPPQQPSIIDYDVTPQPRWRRFVRTAIKVLVPLSLIASIVLIVNILPPFSTKGWRSCSNCARREVVASTLCGLSRSTTPAAPGPLETYFIRTGASCSHTWNTYITDETYPWFGRAVGRTAGVGASPAYLLNSTMRMHTVSDAEVSEAINLLQSNDMQAFTQWQARIQFRSPSPSTLPATNISIPNVARD